MKVTVYAAPDQIGRAAQLAVIHTHDTKPGDVLGVLEGPNAYTIKHNRAGISIWHYVANRGAINTDQWEQG